MSRPDVDGLNAGYAALILEQYLENPSAVPSEWRDLFESRPEALIAAQPGLARLLELGGNGDGNGHAAPAAVAPPPPRPAPPAPAPSAPPAPAPATGAPPDSELLGGVAAS
ncbi:MAG: hypothetical protein JOZ56_06955, partial [Actinobacteria bacterium]|nr:hypothetical protein [Actinomycetota bacterium]